jgi:hypothetical protein
MFSYRVEVLAGAAKVKVNIGKITEALADTFADPSIFRLSIPTGSQMPIQIKCAFFVRSGEWQSAYLHEA